MERVFAVLRSRGPTWDDSKPLEGQAGWTDHAAFMDALFDERFALLVGPLEGTRDALLVLRASSPSEITERLAADPWTISGHLITKQVSPWQLRLGSLDNSMSQSPMLILVAGPYRSGTGDDPEKMAANLRAMEAYAMPIFRAGHIPVVGEWFALPMLAQAGSKRVGDEVFQEVFHPVAERLVARCDAILRVGGPSQGADQMVKLAGDLGRKVFHRLSEVPGCASAAEPGR